MMRSKASVRDTFVRCTTMAVKQRGEPDPPLESIAHTELRQFTAKATVMEVSELLDIAQPGKRQTLRLTLPRQARMRCQDELVEMMLRRIRRTQALTREQLEAVHDQYCRTEEVLISVFGQVLETAQVQDADAAFGSRVRYCCRNRAALMPWPRNARPCPPGILITTCSCSGRSTRVAAPCCSV